MDGLYVLHRIIAEGAKKVVTKPKRKRITTELFPGHPFFSYKKINYIKTWPGYVTIHYELFSYLRGPATGISPIVS